MAGLYYNLCAKLLWLEVFNLHTIWVYSMFTSGKQLTPSSFHNFFSLGIGAITARFVHSHQLAILAATFVLWVLSMVFICARAKRAGGSFLEDDVSFYLGFSIPFFVGGLLFATCFYTVFG